MRSNPLPSPTTYRVPGVTYTDLPYSKSKNKKTYPARMSVQPAENDAEVTTRNGAGRNNGRRKNNFEDFEEDVDPDRKPLNPNTYATRKTIAQGMLDIALLTANASQLRYVLTLGPEKHENYHLMLGLIITSLVLQLVVALFSLSLSMLRDCCIDKWEYKLSALVINHVNVIAVFLIATVNIVMSGFGVYPANIGKS